MSCINWNVEGKANVSQENNACESFIAAVLRAYDSSYTKDISLETCGPSSVEAALEGLGVDQSQSGALQPSDYYTMWLNDKRKISNPNWTLPINRYIEAYPLLVNALYPGKVSCSIDWFSTDRRKVVELIRKTLLAKDTVAIYNLIDPGHYVAALHIDNRDIVTYNESWMSNYWNRGSTRKRTISLSNFVQNVEIGQVVLRKIT